MAACYNSTTYNSTTINATIDQVWQRISDFHQLDWADPVVTKLAISGALSGKEVGARRILNDAFHETLLSIDPEAHCFTYSIDDGPGPLAQERVSNYIGKVVLQPITDSNTTFIQWSSEFISDTESEVIAFCDPIYIGLLAALKAQFEGSV
jgi:hypothetical protein